MMYSLMFCTSTLKPSPVSRVGHENIENIEYFNLLDLKEATVRVLFET